MWCLQPTRACDAALVRQSNKLCRFTKGAAVNCTNCQAPERHLWVLFGLQRQPELVTLRDGNYVSLLSCPICNTLWCSSPYEPYLSFPYAVCWRNDALAWQHLHDRDKGATLLRWHAFAVGKYWRQLPANELEQVAWHRKRSYGHNPIDAPSTFHAADIPV